MTVEARIGSKNWFVILTHFVNHFALDNSSPSLICAHFVRPKSAEAYSICSYCSIESLVAETAFYFEAAGSDFVARLATAPSHLAMKKTVNFDTTGSVS